MRISIVLFIFTSLFLFSCQKEVDFAVSSGNNGGGNGGNTPGTLLVKTVETSASDSIVTLFSYDANKRLINEKATGINQGSAVDQEFRVYRNASGIVTYFSIIDVDLIASGIDSLTTFVHYNTSSSRYTSSVLLVNTSSLSLADSNVYSFDASGRINNVDNYEGVTGLNTYFLSGTEKYAYSTGGNISQFDIIDIDQSGTVTPVGTTTYNYDNKPSPMHLDNEAIVLGLNQWISPNNIVSGALTNASDPAGNQTLTVNYTYNSDNKPTTSLRTILPDNTSISTAYYYQ
ncbi:MAG: hypothetical protein ACHQF0_10960 [Chitinophagales bacterium]